MYGWLLLHTARAIRPVKVNTMSNINSNGAASTTLFFRRNHPGGGVLGRCSYGLPGVAGIVVFDLGMFEGGIAPATIVLPFAMAAPTARKAAAVTSAVVAAGNVAATVAAAAPAIAAPATVAAAAAAAVGKLVKSASKSGAKSTVAVA